ncbi:PQQ-dependent sugar dehydrogenase [Pelagicoccus mobilis]|uniref:PQQ-dependent sugar dehydrogenase n=1 Tax=Pelagicoccus mobilis TaxID=415221 RepID=A0A934RWG2_9BACT|nr:PQQ-dependent sugar dehydrogenase [Pelagicoccus mobilis]MBK1879010.1 PQQ-dependent sugar dehydrogenase [Pelagicoccus mobilis]
MLPSALYAQGRITTGKVVEQYKQLCASCHGENMEGGLGSSLITGEWKHIGPDLSFVEHVQNGNAAVGMPPFADALSASEIRAMEIYIGEVRYKNSSRKKSKSAQNLNTTYEGGGYSFKMEAVIPEDLGLDTPWSIAFLPDGGILVTERPGSLRIFKNGKLSAPIKGIPTVWEYGQGGLLEVALHPNYEKNGWIYLSFAHMGGQMDGRDHGMTKIVRGKIKGRKWTNEEVIFEAKFEHYIKSGPHFGSRMIFDEQGYLYFTIGERNQGEMAQDNTLPNGKIHRVFDDGRIPPDNPFVGQKNVYPSIWSFGHRNPQGLDIHPITGEIWSSEHGPRGGDEINLIRPAINYGWPIVSYGINYDGTPISEKPTAPGLEDPKHHWTPSIGVSSINFYLGDLFPLWKHDLFVGGLSAHELHRLDVKDGQVLSDEIVIKIKGRIRDIETGPDGALYLALNKPHAVVRLIPNP